MSAPMATPVTQLTPRAPRVAPLDVERVRADFPIFQRRMRGRPLVYLDSGATTQKPRVVIDALEDFYERINANVHRGNYLLSQEATAAYEDARECVAKFIGATDARECIFTRGTTESINLVASSWGRTYLRPGDEIVLSVLEHHSNIVPWQLACAATGAVIKVIPINDRGELALEEYERLLSPRTRLAAITHVSNALGTINDVQTMAAMAHRVGALFLVDGAQWVARRRTDVEELGVDFYAFSGHKLYGPMGIGVLWGRRVLLEQMPPYQGGGDMIESVSFAKTTYAPLPNKFEAGTPHVAGAVGLRAAIEYLDRLGMDRVAQHEDDLLRYATLRLREVPGLRLVGQAASKAGVVSFLLEEPCVSPLDVGATLDLDGIAVRTGHHCCQPLMDSLGIPGTVRLSLGVYNDEGDVDACVAALERLHAQRAAQTPRCTAPAPIPTPARQEPKYPAAAAPSPEAAAAELLEAFDFLEDWQQRYHYLIDLGRKLLPVPEAEKTEANRVKGCQSTVYLSARKRPGTTDVMDFLAESDADLVNGLIAVLQRVFSGQNAADILAFKVEDFFQRLGIDQHLALTRRNGLAAMVQRIRALAQALAEAATTCTKGDCAACDDGGGTSR